MVDSEYHDVFDTTDEIESLNGLNINKQSTNKSCSINYNFMNNYEKLKNQKDNTEINNGKDVNTNTYDPVINNNINNEENIKYKNEIKNKNSKNGSINLYNNISKSLSKLKTIIKYENENEKNREEPIKKRVDANCEINSNEHTSHNENVDKNYDRTDENDFYRSINLNELLKRPTEINSFQNVEKNKGFILKSNNENAFIYENINCNNMNSNNNILTSSKIYLKDNNDRSKVNKNLMNSNNSNNNNYYYYLDNKTEFDLISNNKKEHKNEATNFLEANNIVESNLNKNDINISLVSSESLKKEFSFYSFNEQNNSNHFSLNNNDIKISKISDFPNLNDSEFNDNISFDTFSFKGNINNSLNLDVSTENKKNQTEIVSNINCINEKNNDNTKNEWKNEEGCYLMKNSKSDMNFFSNNNYNSIYYENGLKKSDYKNKMHNDEYTNENFNQNISENNTFSDRVYSIRKSMILEESIVSKKNKNNSNNLNVCSNMNSSETGNINKGKELNRSYISMRPNLTADTTNINNDIVDLPKIKSSANYNQENFDNNKRKINIMSSFDVNNNIFKNYNKETTLKQKRKEIIYETNSSVKDNIKNTSSNFMYANGSYNRKDFNESYEKKNSNNNMNDLSLNKLESLNSSIMDIYTKNNNENNFLDDIVLDDSIFAQGINLNKESLDLFNDSINKSTDKNFKKESFFSSENNGENIFKISLSCNDITSSHYENKVENNIEKNEGNENYVKEENYKKNDYNNNDKMNFKQSFSNVYERNNLKSSLKENLYNKEKSSNNLNAHNLNSFELTLDKNILLKNTMSLQKDYNMEKRKSKTSVVQTFNKYTNDLLNENDIFFKNRKSSINKTDIINNFSKCEKNSLEGKSVNNEFEKFQSSLINRQISNELNKKESAEFNNFSCLNNKSENDHNKKGINDYKLEYKQTFVNENNINKYGAINSDKMHILNNNEEIPENYNILSSGNLKKEDTSIVDVNKDPDIKKCVNDILCNDKENVKDANAYCNNNKYEVEKLKSSNSNNNGEILEVSNYAEERNKIYENNSNHNNSNNNVKYEKYIQGNNNNEITFLNNNSKRKEDSNINKKNDKMDSYECSMIKQEIIYKEANKELGQNVLSSHKKINEINKNYEKSDTEHDTNKNEFYDTKIENYKNNSNACSKNFTNENNFSIHKSNDNLKYDNSHNNDKNELDEKSFNKSGFFTQNRDNLGLLSSDIVHKSNNEINKNKCIESEEECSNYEDSNIKDVVKNKSNNEFKKSYHSNGSLIKNSNMTSIPDILNLGIDNNSPVFFFDNINNSVDYYDKDNFKKSMQKSVIPNEWKLSQEGEEIDNGTNILQNKNRNSSKTVPLNVVKDLFIRPNVKNSSYAFDYNNNKLDNNLFFNDKIKNKISEDVLLHSNTMKEENKNNENDFPFNKVLSETNLIMNEKDRNINYNNNIFSTQRENHTYNNIFHINDKSCKDHIDTQKNSKEKKTLKRKIPSESDNNKLITNSTCYSFEKNDESLKKNYGSYRSGSTMIQSKYLNKEKNIIKQNNIKDVNIELKDEVYNPISNVLNNEKNTFIESFDDNSYLKSRFLKNEFSLNDANYIKTFGHLDKSNNNYNRKNFVKKDSIDYHVNTNNNNDKSNISKEKINKNLKISGYNEDNRIMETEENNYVKYINNNFNHINSANYNNFGLNYVDKPDNNINRNIENEYKKNVADFNYDNNKYKGNNDYMNNKNNKGNDNSTSHIDKFNKRDNNDEKENEKGNMINNREYTNTCNKNNYYKNEHEHNDYEKNKENKYFFNDYDIPVDKSELKKNENKLDDNDYKDNINIFPMHPNSFENEIDKNQIEPDAHKDKKKNSRNVYNDENSENYVAAPFNEKNIVRTNSDLIVISDNKNGTIMHQDKVVDDDIFIDSSYGIRNDSKCKLSEENKRNMENNKVHINYPYQAHNKNKEEFDLCKKGNKNMKYNNEEKHNYEDDIFNKSLNNIVNKDNMHSNITYEPCNNSDNANYKDNNLIKEDKRHMKVEYFNGAIKEDINTEYHNSYNRKRQQEINNFNDMRNKESSKYFNEEINYSDKFNYDHTYKHTDKYVIENNKEFFHKHLKDHQNYNKNNFFYSYEEELEKQKNNKGTCDNKIFNSEKHEEFHFNDFRKSNTDFREVRDTYVVRNNDNKWNERTVESLKSKNIDEKNMFFYDDKDNNYALNNNKSKIISNLTNENYGEKNKNFYNDGSFVEEEYKDGYIKDDNNSLYYHKENNYNDNIYSKYDKNSKKNAFENYHININYDKKDFYYKIDDSCKNKNNNCNYQYNTKNLNYNEANASYKNYNRGYNEYNNLDYYECEHLDDNHKIGNYNKKYTDNYNYSTMNNRVYNNDNNNELEIRKYDIYEENNDISKNENSYVLNKIMNVMINIQNDLKDVKCKLIKKKKKGVNENEEINDILDEKNVALCIKNINTKNNENSKRYSSFLKKEDNNIDKNNNEIYVFDQLDKITNKELSNIKINDYNKMNHHPNNTNIIEDKLSHHQYSSTNNKYMEHLNKNIISNNENKTNAEKDRNTNVNNSIVNKELYNSLNFVLKNLNYEDIEDSDISKSNRLYLFNKFFTSLFYEDNKKMHNFIMFNIYNIEQKRQTHKVSLFLEKDYSVIFPNAYNNLLFYAFDCYNFYKYIKNKFKNSYKIYENSTTCLYISNNYETNLINRIFIEQNNYTDVKYSLNEKRILKTCTKYFLDNFLSLIDKKINIKNIIPLMKKINYEFDKNNLYFFISNFNLMDKIFSDSHGFDCNKKFFEKKCPNIKNFAIFFKSIHDATDFYDMFINNNKIKLDNHRLIIVALHKGKSFNYNKLSFNEFMKTYEKQIYNYYNNYDSMCFGNNAVILFNLSYAIPFYYIEYYKN